MKLVTYIKYFFFLRKRKRTPRDGRLTITVN
jgi:hypothetical protein